MEVWKDIEGYEGLYQVSNLGRVKSLERKEKFKNTFRTRNEKILNQALNSRGYLTVNLCKGGKCKNFTVHRLIILSFLTNPHNNPEVNHKDGIKTNNVISNLEWVTRKENQKHAYDIGLQVSNKGTKHTKSKLTESQIIEIRDSELSQVKLSKIYNVSQPLISKIISRRTWSHI